MIGHIHPVNHYLFEKPFKPFSLPERRHSLSRDDHHHYLVIEVPGIDRADLQVNLSGGYVVVKGKTGNYSVTEKIHVAEGISKASASLLNGVLTVKIERPDSAKSISIPVE